MARKKKKQIDPKDTHVNYVFDLREPYTFCGELIYSYSECGRGRNRVRELFSFPSLIINTHLSHSTSKKVEIGVETVVDLHISDDERMLPLSGSIEKGTGHLRFNIWLPNHIVNHVHLTLISSKPQMLTLFGSDLHYRRGRISGIHLLKEFDEEEL